MAQQIGLHWRLFELLDAMTASIALSLANKEHDGGLELLKTVVNRRALRLQALSFNVMVREAKLSLWRYIVSEEL